MSTHLDEIIIKTCALLKYCLVMVSYLSWPAVSLERKEWLIDNYPQSYTDCISVVKKFASN